MVFQFIINTLHIQFTHEFCKAMNNMSALKLTWLNRNCFWKGISIQREYDAGSHVPYSTYHKKKVSFRIFHFRKTERSWKHLLEISLLFWRRIKNFSVFNILCFSDRHFLSIFSLTVFVNFRFFQTFEKILRFLFSR